MLKTQLSVSNDAVVARQQEGTKTVKPPEIMTTCAQPGYYHICFYDNQQAGGRGQGGLSKRPQPTEHRHKSNKAASKVQHVLFLLRSETELRSR